MEGGWGGEMSQLCLTGLRAELCGLMLREGGREKEELPPPSIYTHTKHMNKDTHE